jgi:uncharacterized protein (DUF1697 family)
MADARLPRRYVALLRGINVGGNNLIKMAELKLCFEKQGFRDVRTYIQSGNVVFSAGAETPGKVCARLEAAIEKTFGCRASVVLRSKKEMGDIVRRAPKGFGKQPAKYRYDVIFLKEPLGSAEVLKGVSRKEGIDRANAGEGVLYFSRLDSKASQSRLGKLMSMPVYKSMTIRNWNTTTKLLELLEEDS